MRVEKIYIADDGTKFFNEKECVTYENENSYKEFFENYGNKIRFYGRDGQFIKKEDLSDFDFDYLDYVYLEDDTLAKITGDYIEKYVPSPFQEFGNIAGYFWWDSDKEEWKDFQTEYNILIEKNKTGFFIEYLLKLGKDV